MIAEIISHLVPKAQFVIRGNPSTPAEYESQVDWLDERLQPSWTDIEDARSSVETVIANRNAQQLRRSAFQAEADPLFFGWQRGENTEQAWRDKCDEIRARYPYQ